MESKDVNGLPDTLLCDLLEAIEGTRFGRHPPVVRTTVFVDGRFEHIGLSYNATSDHVILWIEREGQKALDLMLQKDRIMEIPPKQRMERQETLAKEHGEEHKAALRRAVTVSVPDAVSPTAYVREGNLAFLPYSWTNGSAQICADTTTPHVLQQMAYLCMFLSLIPSSPRFQSAFSSEGSQSFEMACYCCFAALRPDIVLDFKKVIKRNLQLKVIAESYNTTIMPSIKSNLATVVRWLDYLLSGVAVIRCSLISRHTFNETKKKQRRKVINAYSKIVAELNKLMLFPSHLAPGALEETMNPLRLQMDRISKRKRSMKRWRKVCTAVVMAVTVSMVMISIGFALAGAGPVAVAVGASGATAIKAVEPLVHAALEEKERKLPPTGGLKEEEEVVEMMRDGEQLIVHEFNGIRRLTEEIMNKYLNFARHIKAVKKAAPEMEKMIDEIESNAMDLKGKINLYTHQIEQFQVKFIRMIKN
ncbi:uncharacterized protein LOC141827066 [Curcuma longa]|uniref:uncharacterized protein LOC141827066 n=1 Tax=Curcuma longa TaxID=136217 RepID=UPI003D9F8E31